MFVSILPKTPRNLYNGAIFLFFHLVFLVRNMRKAGYGFPVKITFIYKTPPLPFEAKGEF